MALSFPANPNVGDVYSPGPGQPSWVWDGHKWTSGAFVASPPPPLATLPDVAITSPAAGQALTYSGTNWTNTASVGVGATFNWDSAGLHYGMGTVATSDTRFHLLGSANESACLIDSGPRPVGTYMVRIAGQYTTGLDNGLLIYAGSGPSDIALNVANSAQTLNLLMVRGNGQIQVPSIPLLTSPPYMIGMASGGYIGYVTASSIKGKQNVHSITRDAARRMVAGLRPITFHSKYDHEDQSIEHYGLIAEEVAEIDGHLVGVDEEGNPVSVHYDKIAMMLLPILREMLGIDEPEEVTYG